MRHHTNDAGLAAIRASGVIQTSRGWGRVAYGVHVEVEPFGTTRPEGLHSPRADFGIMEGGAFVEFDAPPNLVPITTGLGPRNGGIIPTAYNQPLVVQGLNPAFVRVRWHFWEFWRTRPE